MANRHGPASWRVNQPHAKGAIAGDAVTARERPGAYARTMWNDRRTVRSARLLVVVVALAACGSSSTKAQTLADYAAGRWTCKLTTTSDASGSAAQQGILPPGGLRPSAVVTATSATSGRVVVTIAGLPSIAPKSSTKFGGQWALQSDHLMVTWDDKTQGTMQAAPISLNTTKFETESGTPESHPQWSEVKVHRQSRSVSFDFNLVPGITWPAQLTCSKA